MSNTHAPRAFKTSWFAKAAKKALITDDELCAAFHQILLGQCDDLGGGVYKKRLDKNRHRSIVISKGSDFWIYTYLFAKKDRANIEESELRYFRATAALYARETDAYIAQELELQQLVEICQ